MKEYGKEASVIKSDDCEKSKQPLSKKAALSRRKFLRNAAISAVATGATLAMKGGSNLLAQSEDSGEVTVDGIMLTYIGAPLGSISSSSWSITKSHTHTMRVVASQNLSISIKSDIGFNITKTFSVGGSVTFRQTDSTQVTNAITLRRSTTETITTPAPGTVGNTVILGLRRPQIQFVGNPSLLRFQFLNAQQQFAIKVSDFQSNPSTMSLFSADTINSFLAQYAPLDDPTGSALVKPRYKLRLSQLLSAGVTDVFTFSKASGGSHSESKTATTTVEIVERTGFNLFGVIKTALEVGERLEFTKTVTQEFSADKIMSVSTTLNRSSFGVSEVYWDRVWKTFVIVDKGVPDMSQPTVQGTIRDANGFPISGAFVRVVQDNAEYAGRTDANGQYLIATPSGYPLTNGSHTIKCGTTNQTVFIGSGAATVNFYGVDPISATEPEFDGELFNLN